MSTQGPNGPTTGANDSSFGAQAWTNPGNVTTNDTNYATAPGSANNPNTNYLKATGFGFTIPAGSTINGIVVEWRRKSSDISDGKDSVIKLVKAGSVVGTDHKSASFWGLEAFATYGTSSDLWGTTWSVSEINAADFGAVLAGSADNAVTTLSVNYCRITITYTEASGFTKLVTSGGLAGVGGVIVGPGGLAG